MAHLFLLAELNRRRAVRPAIPLVLLVAMVTVVLAGCTTAAPQSGVTTLQDTGTVAPEVVTSDGATSVPEPATADFVSSPDATSAAPTTVGETSVDEEAPSASDDAPEDSAARVAPEPAGNPLDETTNILILGSDRRPDTPNWRTDVMMIVALDQERGRAGVISIPRDVYVDEIPNHQPNRINVVDYLGEQDEPDGGGPALLGDIIQERMGVRIDHFVRFDFDSFRDVVDALGGVEVDVDCEFRGYIEDEGGWLVLEPGLNRLTGNQAMIYVRDRELTGGDLQRARRQQRFVWAVRNQVLTENMIGRLPALYSALSGAIDTDLGLIRTLQLTRFAVGLDADDLYGMVVGPPEMIAEGWRNGMAVFVPDWPVIADNVQQVFAHEPFLIDNTPVECRP